MSERELDWDEPAASTNYVRVPNWVVDHTGLSIYAKGLYAAISRHINNESGNAWPGIPLLAQIVGCGTTKITDAINELEACGALAKKRRGRGMSNLYRLRFSDPKSTATRSSRTPSRGAVDDRHAVPNKNEENKTESVVVERERASTSHPAQVDAVGALIACGFDDLTIDRWRSAIDSTLHEFAPPPDTDWFAFGVKLRGYRESGACKSPRPDAALKFVFKSADGVPRIGLFGGAPVSGGRGARPETRLQAMERRDAEREARMEGRAA